MTKKKFVMRFPPELIDQPITYRLVKEYGLMINILQGTVTPREEGRLVVEISGARKAMEEGLAYLSGLGVELQPLAHDIHWHQNRCTNCTACVSLCPTGAFVLDRESMEVSFDKKQCIACELCVRACPYRAVEILF